jgi:arylsulfatase A-like enzyme/glycosyltransferase involved in cell wall biosynthesis
MEDAKQYPEIMNIIKPKKIVLIIIDTLRPDHLGCYGYKRKTSPNIDDLAKESFLFKHAFSPSSLTIPSICSILTSKYPGNHSIGFDPQGKLDPNIDITLASILCNNNYKTAAFVGSRYLRKNTNLNAGFELYEDETGFDQNGRRDCLTTNLQVIKWLEENYDQNFFLFVHYFDVHGPYVTQEPFKSEFVNDEFYGEPEYVQDTFDIDPAFDSIPEYQILNPVKNESTNLLDHEKDVRYYKAQYDGCIRHLDDNLGQLIKKLKELVIYDDSLIIVTSDHGEAHGENNIFFSHGLTVTLDQTSVPLLLKPHKDKEIKNKLINTPLSTIDIMPTVLSLCDHDYSSIKIEGHSLAKILEDEEYPLLKDRTLVSENERQFALIQSCGLMELKKKDDPVSSYQPHMPALIDSLNWKKFYWDSGNEYTLTIPFDKYQRYKIIADIINKFRKDNKIFKILDVGAGFEKTLKKFLPDDDIYFFDKDYPPELKTRAKFITGDITKVDLSDSYDFVISIDAYEHISPISREGFINKLIHLSKIATIVAAPFDTPGVREHEVLANEVYKTSHDADYKWLHEHIQNGLPSLPFTLEIIKKSGFKYTVIPNGYLPRWFEMISIFLLTEGMTELSRSMEELNEFYNKKFYLYDNLNPAYRQVIFISKIVNIPDFFDINAKDTILDREFNTKFETLQSFIKKIKELSSNYKYKELIEKSAQVIELSNSLKAKDEQMRALELQINSLTNSLQSIEQSIVWQLLMKFDGFIEKVLPHGTRRRGLYERGLVGVRTIVKEGWRTFWWKFNDYRSSKKILYKSKIKLPKLDIQTFSSFENLKVIEQKISIVIPTKNAGLDFEFTLEKIRNQKGIKETEIVIVDSGSTDETVNLAEKFTSKIFHIKPEEFNHGETRNYGAEKATGDYILFMVQDAIPIGEYWLYNMIMVLENDSQIAAVSCRQVPRSDADLFACFSLWHHYRMLDFTEDRISPPNQELNGLSPIEKRKLAGLEDVCCLMRKDIFNNLKFKNIKYAEDLELGLRILQKDYKIAFLYSVGVIHSHNRNPHYFFKRSYVDNKELSKILSYKPLNFTKDYGVNEIFGDILILYTALNASIESLKLLSFDENSKDINLKLRSLIQNNLKIDSSDRKKFSRGNKSLDNLFDEMQKIVGSNYIKSNDFMIQHYLNLLDNFNDYTKIYKSLSDKKSELFDTWYEIFAITTGSAIANYYLFKSNNGDINEKLLIIDSILSEGT